jgi:hypothetical protein
MIQIDQKGGRFINNPLGKARCCSTRGLRTKRPAGFEYLDDVDYIFDIVDKRLVPRPMTPTEREQAAECLMQHAYDKARASVWVVGCRAQQLTRQMFNQLHVVRSIGGK